MPASFNLTLDTQAPANPSILINGGAALTGERAVWVAIATASTDATHMKVWGDIDGTADPAFRVMESESQWLPLEGMVALMLSVGAGRKHLYSRLRDDVGNETLVFTDFIDYDPSVPFVTITTAVDRSRISKVSPYDTATFTWEASAPFSAYEVRVVPTHGSPRQSGVSIGSTSGSVNTSGSAGVYGANSPITTTIRGEDLETASPGNTVKVVKVFVLDSSGVWSA